MATDPPLDPTAETAPARDDTRPEHRPIDVDLERVLAVLPDQRYRPMRMLGEGGMGEVELVVDEVIGREVALKRLKRVVVADPGARDALAQEAILQGRLEHPSIVPVYDFARTRDGELFFTMRRVRGRSLAHTLAEVPASYSRVRLLTAFVQVCLAAHFAHEQGIVHRDLKPANIMLGDYGEVYLLDWGIAHVATDDLGAHAGSGTAGYMSPEQARGGREAGPRSDVYALGAILFEILAGTPLHALAPIGDMLASIANGVDARPSVRAPDADVPPELEAICVKATALDPGQRYASARALSNEVERYLEGDRDLALRGRMSHEQAAIAAELASRAADNTQVRGEALRAVGRALAFDPANAEALGTLVELLTQPPREVPPAAAEEMRANERALDRTRSRTGAAAIAVWTIIMTTTPWLFGIESKIHYAIALSTVVVALVLGLLRLRYPRADGFIPSYLVIGISVAIAGLGIGLHPFFITPGLGLLLIIGATLSIDTRRRFLPLVAGCLAFVVPVVLEWLHVLAPSYIALGDVLCMPSRMARLSNAMPAGPLALNLVVVVVGVLYTLRFRAALTDMQRRNSINAWQLRQLLPRLDPRNPG